MRDLVAMLLAVGMTLGCAPTRDRPIGPGDLIFGKYPGQEVLLRVRAQCLVSSGDGSVYVFPAGDYHPVAADSNGLFFEPPLNVELKRGDDGVWLFGVGIYYPFIMASGRHPAVWIEGVGLERGSLFRDKRTRLPEQCWRPYGLAMVIVHNGLEVSSR